MRDHSANAKILNGCQVTFGENKTQMFETSKAIKRWKAETTRAKLVAAASFRI